MPKIPMTPEHRKALILGKELAKKKREAGISTPKKKKNSVFDKPLVIFTGEERNAFDFIPKVRDAFRKQYNYISYPKIVSEIADPKIWENVGIIMRILEKYCILEKGLPKKEKKPRNTSYVMTPEHKLKMKLAREAKKG